MANVDPEMQTGIISSNFFFLPERRAETPGRGAPVSFELNIPAFFRG